MKNVKLFTRGFSAVPLPKTATYYALVLVALVCVISGCNKAGQQGTSPSGLSNIANPGSDRSLSANFQPVANVEEVLLVSDAGGIGAARTDANLVNPWGMAFSPEGAVWIASNRKGLSVVYDLNGNQLRTPVDIPLNGVHFGSSPTGVVYNTTNGFKMRSGMQTSTYIFVTENGTIEAWSGGDTTETVVDHSSTGAVYKGAAIANFGGKNYLYVTNFNSGKIEVFDEGFSYLQNGLTTGMLASFTDAQIPQVLLLST